MTTPNPFWTAEYEDNIGTASQNMGGDIFPFCRKETQSGESEYFQYYGATEAVESTASYEDTPNITQVHNRRRVTTTPHVWSTQIDHKDIARMMTDPTSSLIRSGIMALNRKFDIAVYTAMLGTATGGKDGTSSYTFGQGLTDTNIVAVNEGGAGNTNLTVAKLIKAAELMDTLSVPSFGRHIAAHPAQKAALLGITQVTSTDYAAVRALVNGEVDTFMGFKFHWTPLITTSTYRDVVAWQEDGVIASTNIKDGEVFSRIDQRPDKNYNLQLYIRREAGAVRLEEASVVKILCNEG